MYNVSWNWRIRNPEIRCKWQAVKMEGNYLNVLNICICRRGCMNNLCTCGKQTGNFKKKKCLNKSAIINLTYYSLEASALR